CSLLDEQRLRARRVPWSAWARRMHRSSIWKRRPSTSTWGDWPSWIHPRGRTGRFAWRTWSRWSRHDCIGPRGSARRWSFPPWPHPQISAPQPGPPRPEPSPADLLLDALVEQVAHPLRSLADIAGRTLRAPSRVAREVGDLLEGLLDVVGAGVFAPPSPFNR